MRKVQCSPTRHGQSIERETSGDNLELDGKRSIWQKFLYSAKISTSLEWRYIEEVKEMKKRPLHESMLYLVSKKTTILNISQVMNMVCNGELLFIVSLNSRTHLWLDEKGYKWAPRSNRCFSVPSMVSIFIATVLQMYSNIHSPIHY